MIRNSIFSILSLLTLIIFGTSCEHKTVEEDMNDYCECLDAVRNGEKDFKICQDIMIDISTKYEFDPEAVETIRNKAAECK